MMPRRLFLAAGSVFILLLPSCAPKRGLVLLDTQAVDAATLIRIVNSQQDRLQTMIGSGNLTFESPEIAGTASFDLALKKPDSLLVRLEGPFGIDLGTFFLSKNKYLVYNSLKNRVVTGSPDASSLRAIIPFDLTYDQLMNAFSGLIPLPSDPREVLEYSVDEGQFSLSIRCGTRTCQYWIDPDHGVVTKYQMRNPEGETILEATASAIAEENGVNLPRRVRVTFPTEDRQISITYSSLSPNAPHPSFEFTFPANAETIVR